MRAKDFKVGDRVRGVHTGYRCEGLRDGEIGTVVGHLYEVMVNVVHSRNKIEWHMRPDELELVVAQASAPSVADDLKLTPQAKSVLRSLKHHGRISPMKALVALGVSRLASCIHEIRHRAGYDVKTTVKRDEQGHKYAEYSLSVN